MTDNEIIANEILCIRRRASGRCNGGTDCNTCDLLMNETEIIKAYQRAMKQNDLINRQKAENERLKKNIDGLNIFTKNHITVIRLQAIKEFAERLKENYCFTDRWGKIIPISTVDNLVKEMTEVNENENQN